MNTPVAVPERLAALNDNTRNKLMTHDGKYLHCASGLSIRFQVIASVFGWAFFVSAFFVSALFYRRLLEKVLHGVRNCCGDQCASDAHRMRSVARQ